MAYCLAHPSRVPERWSQERLLKRFPVIIQFAACAAQARVSAFPLQTQGEVIRPSSPSILTAGGVGVCVCDLGYRHGMEIKKRERVFGDSAEYPLTTEALSRVALPFGALVSESAHAHQGVPIKQQ